MNNIHNNIKAGFRLQHFEILNWGTFHAYPQKLDIQGNTVLLTGNNGSGKSTLVDGLLTLLVPNRKRNYNQASSGTGKKERTEKSYVQGAYGRVASESHEKPKEQVLRDKGYSIPSILLAFFQDQQNQQMLTLAQVLYIKESVVEKFFVISDQELSIASDFSKFTNIKELKKQLKNSGSEVFDNFKKYNQKLLKRLSVQSQKALDLFNETVSIKEIGGLNNFVRDHMLEKADVETKISEFKNSYENLIASYEAIQKARKQLEILVPLTEKAAEYEQEQEKIETLKKQQNILPAFFAQEKLNLLEKESQDIKQNLDQLQQEQKECEQALEILRDQEKNISFSIKNDQVGQQLEKLKDRIEQSKKTIYSQKKEAQKYDELAQRLGLPLYCDRNTFHQARIEGESLKQDIEQILDDLQSQRDLQIPQKSNLKHQKEELTDELQSLRQRKSQIPEQNLKIRNKLVRDLELQETDLPFIGELLQVRPDAKAWEGAIERLLRGFGLCLLVSEKHYQRVNRYVNTTNLRGRLVYYQVGQGSPNPTQRSANPQQILYKLETKQDNHTFYQWIQERLNNQYNYFCCDTETEFSQYNRAITITGLIKHSGQRHEKDDRSSIHDRRQYILGWNNAEKIQALEEELAKVNEQLQQIDQKIKDIEKQRKQRNTQERWLQDFMRFTEFTTIDWHSTQLEYNTLLEQKQELESSSDHLKELQKQLEITQEQIKQLEDKKESLTGDIRSRQDRHSNIHKEQNQCQLKLESISIHEIETFAKQFSKKLKKYSLTLETMRDDEDKFKNDLQEKLEESKNKVNTIKSSLTMQMYNFNANFNEYSFDLRTTIDFLDEYIELKEKIETNDLPKYEKRFKDYLNQNLVMYFDEFRVFLENQEEDIKQAIDELNESLNKINYTDSTYIHLCYEKNRDPEIQEFRTTIKKCLGDSERQDTEDNEIRFKNIQNYLIKRFENEERWTKKVTDVRNWLNFSVSERYCENHAEKEHHTDSSGKSGGQKVKLAYTILASAIAYQYGLYAETRHNQSFRLVVIDEAFSRSDDSNSRYVMELFKKLDLQLLVITPRDKIEVISPYIASLQLVSIDTEGKNSQITPITIEEYSKQKQHLLFSTAS